jgi:inosose dehydratase
MTTRREFLVKSSLFSVAAALPISLFAAKKSYSLGYSSITWSGQDEQAIQDIASLGFKGIQLRANTFAKYGESHK